MRLATQVATTAKQQSGVTRIEQAQRCCVLAKQLEAAGEYEGARLVLSPFWPKLAQQPTVEGLDRQSAAEVLLRAGALIGWLGGANQSQCQESAKNLIMSSIEMFIELDSSTRAAEAQSDLALCYWREGGFDEARVNLAEALERVRDENSDLKAMILIRAAEVERSAGCLKDALRFLEMSNLLINQSSQSALKGSFHITLASVLNQLSVSEGRVDHRDKALIEYAAASFHFEQAGHMRQCGRVENNLGFLYQSIGRFPEAHQHITRARDIFLSLGDRGHVAQVDETRARALLAEGRLHEAERYARAAVRTLDRGDECSLLVEALTTLGVTLARLGNYASARSHLNRAVAIGENCGDLEGAGRAKLCIIEELSGQTSPTDLASIYSSALELLQISQDPSATQRLMAASTTVMNTFLAAQTQGPDLEVGSWESFSLKKELRAFEKAVLERALRDAGGSVTTASRLLGFRHHQSLISLINTRHRDLLKTRSAVRKRRQSILAKPGQAGKNNTSSKAKPDAAQISVLHIEDNKEVAQVITDLLTDSGMEVDTCANGMTALRMLTGDTHYDVVIVDHDLPGLNGLDLVRRARKIVHRRHTPIVMLSGDDIETEAWRAGVQEFLRKPQDVNRVALTVERLVKGRDKPV